MTPTIALFSIRGGIGTTRLAYHLAHMVARLGWRVLAVDLDPQANLTSAFFDEDKLELFWEPESTHTVLSAVPRSSASSGTCRFRSPVRPPNGCGWCPVTLG